MTIASIVTRGYGSFGSIAEVVTRGYSLGEAAETDNRSGASYLTPQEMALLVRAVKLRRDQRDVNEWLRLQEELEQAEKAKRREAERMAKASPVATVAELPPKPPGKTPGRKPSTFDFAAAEGRMAALEASMRQVQQFMTEIEERETDEDDIETILLIMH